MAKLALEYGWSKREILEEVFPEEVGPLLDAALKRRAEMNLEAMAVASSPYLSQEKRETLFKRWERIAYPQMEENTVFDPSQLLSQGIPGVGLSPEMVEQLKRKTG